VHLRQHPVRIHELRHSFASIAAANGASLPMIGKPLGRSSSLTTQLFADLVADPIKHLADTVGSTVAGARRKLDQCRPEIRVSADAILLRPTSDAMLAAVGMGQKATG